MLDAVRRFLASHGIGPCHVLVACSGGVDSTALLLVLADLRDEGFTVTAAHVNHHLRGDESDADEQFVRELCNRIGVPLRVTDGTLDPERIRQTGIEAAAREVRQERLSALAREAGADYIATAHQKNDQAETVLMRLVTGTGLAGLRGIHPRRDDDWIRPLLDVTRQQIEEHLRERGISPRIDRMNADLRFLRNRIRQMLNELGREAVANLASIADQARQVWPNLERIIDQAEKTCTRVTATETRFARWPDEPWVRQALLHRHIRRLGSARDVSSRDLQRITASLEDVRRLSVTRDLELVRRRGALVLRRKEEATPEFELEIRAPASAFIPEIGATISVSPGASGTQLIQLPEPGEPRFTVRNRRRGDRFQPLGMTRDKKLKDFLIDRKIDAELRDRIPLLIWNGEIAWIAGVEVSERFKVTRPGGPLYEVKLEHASEHREDLDRL